MPSFNLADLFEITADRVPDRCALVAGEVRRSYAELDERATRFASHLTGSGVKPGEHVAIIAWNRSEWLEAMLGAFKARAVPVNINYRYTAQELGYVLRDAEAVAVVADPEFIEALEEVGPSLPDLRSVLVLDPGPQAPTALAADRTAQRVQRFEDALRAASPERDPAPRSGDDHYLLYTGGTTGQPKGVLWRVEDLFFAALGGGRPGREPVTAPEQIAEVIPPAARPWLVTSPLMHGNGQWNSLVPLLTGAGVVLWTGRRFDAAEVARLAEQERAALLVLVGDGMALPFANVIEETPGRYDLSGVKVIASGGAILSPAVKRRLSASMPRCSIVDGFGASETGSNGRLVGAGDGDAPPRFTTSEDTAVLDDDLRPLPPGSTEIGRLARRGHVPLGYWNDAEKSKATFPIAADGTRWAIPGDLARHEADGTITLLGRGSSCINSGGEKIHPEEVALAVKSHPGVLDAFVVGAPDDRFGQRVVAIITARDGTTPDLGELRQHLRSHLAGYKAPRQLIIAGELRYTPQGKPDLRWAEQLAASTLKG